MFRRYWWSMVLLWRSAAPDGGFCFWFEPLLGGWKGVLFAWCFDGTRFRKGLRFSWAAPRLSWPVLFGCFLVRFLWLLCRLRFWAGWLLGYLLCFQVRFVEFECGALDIVKLWLFLECIRWWTVWWYLHKQRGVACATIFCVGFVSLSMWNTFLLSVCCISYVSSGWMYGLHRMFHCFVMRLFLSLGRKFCL